VPHNKLVSSSSCDISLFKSSFVTILILKFILYFSFQNVGLHNNSTESEQMATTSERVRNILAQHAKLSVDIKSLSDDSDLYGAGLSSFATVQLMLALEEEFGIEIPDRLLNRRSFESIAAIAGVVHSVSGIREAG